MAIIKSALLLWVCVSSLDALKWDGFVGTWGPLAGVSRLTNTAFWDLPQTQAKAKSEGWVQVDSDSSYWTTWCLAGDGRVCLNYDQNGFIAGAEVGLPYQDYATPHFNPAVHKMYKNVTRFDETITLGRFFLVSQDVLKSGGRANMDDGLGTGLWLENGDSLMEVPLNEAQLKSDTDFVEENCIPTMGKHYYYNVTPAMHCEDFEPYFLLTDIKSGDLLGLGFQSIGMPSHKSRKWFEPVPSVAIKPTVPTTPDCLVDWAAKYGVISMHFYFVSNPTSIGCGWLG